MTLTKKHFKVLAVDMARLFREVDITETKEQTKSAIARFVINFCREQNGLFDTDRFNDAVNDELLKGVEKADA